MNDAVAWCIDKSALTHSEPRRYAIVRTWNSYRRNRACYADDGHSASAWLATAIRRGVK
jgi:hypothetical protein